MSNSIHEKRQSKRYPTQLKVDYSCKDNFLISYIENISDMGIFIRSDNPPEVGETINIRFSVEQDDEIQIMGRVAWINPVRDNSENLNPGMGIEFLDVSESQRKQLTSAIKSIAYLSKEQSA